MLLNLALAIPRSELIIESAGLNDFSAFFYMIAKLVWIVFLVLNTIHPSDSELENSKHSSFLGGSLAACGFIFLFIIYAALEFMENGQGLAIYLLNQLGSKVIAFLIFIAIGIIGSLQDLKTQRINVLLLYFLFQISWYLRCEEGPISILFIAFCLAVLFLITPFRIFEGKKIGAADIIFTLSVSLQFPLKALPFFLFSSGALGICTYFLFKRQSPFPFFPALFLSWGLTTLLYRGLP